MGEVTRSTIDRVGGNLVQYDKKTTEKNPVGTICFAGFSSENNYSPKYAGLRAEQIGLGKQGGVQSTCTRYIHNIS